LISDQKNSANTKFMRPYLRLSKYFSEEFVELSIELLFLVRDYGVSKTNDVIKSPENTVTFLYAIHDGWKIAQKKIANALIDALRSLEELKRQRKENRGRWKSEQYSENDRAIYVANLQINVLRRMLDIILWTIFACEQSTLRRFYISGGENNLSIANINEAMQVADDINVDEGTIAICTDMLSQVHVGDLLVRSFSPSKTYFVELKSGEKNVAFSQAAKFAVDSQCEHFEKIFTSNLNSADRKHFERAKRQFSRANTISQTVQNEKGLDPNTGAQVYILPLNEPPRYWTSVIVDCYEQLTPEKRWAIHTVEGCVHVGVYSDQPSAIAFGLWMQTIKCECPIYNLMDSFNIPSCRPLGAMNIPSELVRKIFSGEVLVILCLDLVRLMEITNSMKEGYLTLASKRDSAEARKNHYSSVEYKGQIIQTNSREGAGYLGMGMVERILFDQHSPVQLMHHHIATHV